MSASTKDAWLTELVNFVFIVSLTVFNKPINVNPSKKMFRIKLCVPTFNHGRIIPSVEVPLERMYDIKGEEYRYFRYGHSLSGKRIESWIKLWAPHPVEGPFSKPMFAWNDLVEKFQNRGHPL